MRWLRIDLPPARLALSVTAISRPDWAWIHNRVGITGRTGPCDHLAVACRAARAASCRGRELIGPAVGGVAAAGGCRGYDGRGGPGEAQLPQEKLRISAHLEKLAASLRRANSRNLGIGGRRQERGIGKEREPGDAAFASIFPPRRLSRGAPGPALLQARSGLLGGSADPRGFSPGEAPRAGTSFREKRLLFGDSRERCQSRWERGPEKGQRRAREA
jgi:hypothetical protein